MKRKFSTSTKNEKEEKDRVGVAGEPEMPTKTYVCLKHGVHFEPLEKVVFDERLWQICKFLAGSFSAVSKRNFARKYAFDSIFQALQDLHPFAPLQSQNFSKKSVWKISNFREISAKILQMSDLCVYDSRTKQHNGQRMKTVITSPWRIPARPAYKSRLELNRILYENIHKMD